MTEQDYVPAGPVCDFCEQEDAIGSLMNLADYQTQKFGPDCGPEYLLSVVRAMAGDIPAESGPDAAPDPTATGQTAPTAEPATGSGSDAGPDASDGPAPGFPGTENVVRSTHGHRGKRGESAGTPAGDRAP